jgi:Fe-S-cluster containining protein
MTDIMKPKALSTDWAGPEHRWLVIRAKDFELDLHRYEVQKLLSRLTLAERPPPPPTPQDQCRFDIRSTLPHFLGESGRDVTIGPLGFKLNDDELGEWVEELRRRLAEPAEPDPDAEDGGRRSLPVLNCDGCGACCMHMGYPPSYPAFFKRDETNRLLPLRERKRMGFEETGVRWEEIPRGVRRHLGQYFLDVDVKEVRENLSFAGKPCIWWDQHTRKCKHYEIRPSICRDFEVGAEDCLRFRDERDIDDDIYDDID